MRFTRSYSGTSPRPGPLSTRRKISASPHSPALAKMNPGPTPAIKRSSGQDARPVLRRSRQQDKLSPVSKVERGRSAPCALRTSLRRNLFSATCSGKRSALYSRGIIGINFGPRADVVCLRIGSESRAGAILEKHQAVKKALRVPCGSGAWGEVLGIKAFRIILLCNAKQ